MSVSITLPKQTLWKKTLHTSGELKFLMVLNGLLRKCSVLQPEKKIALHFHVLVAVATNLLSCVSVISVGQAQIVQFPQKTRVSTCSVFRLTLKEVPLYLLLPEYVLVEVQQLLW